MDRWGAHDGVGWGLRAPTVMSAGTAAGSSQAGGDGGKPFSLGGSHGTGPRATSRPAAPWLRVLTGSIATPVSTASGSPSSPPWYTKVILSSASISAVTAIILRTPISTPPKPLMTRVWSWLVSAQAPPPCAART